MAVRSAAAPRPERAGIRTGSRVGQNLTTSRLIVAPPVAPSPLPSGPETAVVGATTPVGDAKSEFGTGGKAKRRGRGRKTHSTRQFSTSRHHPETSASQTVPAPDQRLRPLAPIPLRLHRLVELLRQRQPRQARFIFSASASAMPMSLMKCST